MDGIIVINKEKDQTSRDVVNYLNDLFEMNKIGHCGTLDPIATGVLIIALGKCTKFTDIITTKDKEYIATMRLGIKTDTYDITGEILSQNDTSFSEKEIIESLNFFNKDYEQEVPIYSAIKVNGKRLYHYARNNESVVLPKRIVSIKEIELMKINNNDVTFKVLVSKGTYIRSLINDLGNYLGCGATMTELIRTKQGEYCLEDANTMQDINNGNYKFITLEEIIKKYPSKIIDENQKKLITNGAVIDKEFTSEYFVYYDENNKPLAIYQEYAKDENKANPFLMIKENK